MQRIWVRAEIGALSSLRIQHVVTQLPCRAVFLPRDRLAYQYQQTAPRVTLERGSGLCVLSHGEQGPPAGYAFEAVLAAGGEGEGRFGH
jgi:hypothetical protein